MPSPFTSSRERLLWSATVAVIAATWLALALTRTLSDSFTNQGMVNAAFGLGTLLFLAAVAAVGLRLRPRGAELGVWLGVAAAYVLMMVRVGSIAERTHLIEYGVVALLVLEALRERARNGAWVPVPPLLAVVLTIKLGVLDEVIQWFVPSRVFDPLDILFNSLAAVMAVTATSLLSWAGGKLGAGSEHPAGDG